MKSAKLVLGVVLALLSLPAAARAGEGEWPARARQALLVLPSRPRRVMWD